MLTMVETMPHQAYKLATEMIRRDAGTGLLSELPVGLLLVIVIVILLLSQEDLGVGTAV